MPAKLKAVPTTEIDIPDTAPLADYSPVVLKSRHDGWTVARQKIFLTVLAETGSISHACIEAGISARSAYRLRAQPGATAFAEAWENALKMATLQLVTLAFERATRGTVKEYWKNGELVGHTRSPSDKLLMFVLTHLVARGADSPAAQNGALADAASAAFPSALARLVDSDVPLVPIEYRDFFPETPEAPDVPNPPGDGEENW